MICVQNYGYISRYLDTPFFVANEFIEQSFLRIPCFQHTE